MYIATNQDGAAAPRGKESPLEGEGDGAPDQETLVKAHAQMVQLATVLLERLVFFIPFRCFLSF